MKKIILLFVAFAAQTNYAQSIFPTDGSNVGIGTTSPTQKLDVNGNAIFKGAIISSMSDVSGGGHIRLQNPSKISNGIANTWMIYNMAADFGNSLQFWAYDKLGCAGGGMCSNRFTIMDNGNVGIGTAAPKQKLTMVGNQNAVDQGAPTNGQSSTAILRLQSSPGGAGEVLDFGMNIKSYGWIQPQDFNDPNAFYNLILNAKGGSVGIGTTTPDAKLAVNGTIHSKEVKVDMLGWPDYVFKKEYNLPTLEEVEKHINEKGHLENIPSQEEVLKNGINLGEMNAKLLQKMEEMTLYMIEMKKDIEVLKEENKVLKVKK